MQPVNIHHLYQRINTHVHLFCISTGFGLVVLVRLIALLLMLVCIQDGMLRTVIIDNCMGGSVACVHHALVGHVCGDNVCVYVCVYVGG